MWWNRLIGFLGSGGDKPRKKVKLRLAVALAVLCFLFTQVRQSTADLLFAPTGYALAVATEQKSGKRIAVLFAFDRIQFRFVKKRSDIPADVNATADVVSNKYVPAPPPEYPFIKGPQTKFIFTGSLQLYLGDLREKESMEAWVRAQDKRVKEVVFAYSRGTRGPPSDAPSSARLLARMIDGEVQSDIIVYVVGSAREMHFPATFNQSRFSSILVAKKDGYTFDLAPTEKDYNEFIPAKLSNPQNGNALLADEIFSNETDLDRVRTAEIERRALLRNKSKSFPPLQSRPPPYPFMVGNTSPLTGTDLPLVFVPGHTGSYATSLDDIVGQNPNLADLLKKQFKTPPGYYEPRLTPRLLEVPKFRVLIP